MLKMVGVQGFEPWTPWSQTRCATRLRYTPKLGGGGRDRTDDIMLAKHTLSQLSYTPEYGSLSWARTSDTLINSQVLYQLSYQGIKQYL